MVDLGGLQLHALVHGNGSPVVVLEPALGGFALQYAHIQEAVSAFTTVLAYDRAGQGWSDPGPGPRTPARLEEELWALLEKLGLRPPYVLVGHSLGGLLVRIYAGRHPKEVAGVVLIDSSHEDQNESLPDPEKMVGQAAMGVRLMKLASGIGLGRQMARLSLGSMAKTLPKEDLDAFLAVVSQPKHHEGMLAEFTQHRCYFGPQSEVPRALGNVPLVVITAGSSLSGQHKIGKLTADQVNEQHQQRQKSLVRISPRGEQVVIPGAAHLTILTQPEYAAQVVDAIRRVVEKVRAENACPAPSEIVSG
jgi:pimeloyl-ACP methyl ester carboxylesterase